MSSFRLLRAYTPSARPCRRAGGKQPICKLTTRRVFFIQSFYTVYGRVRDASLLLSGKIPHLTANSFCLFHRLKRFLHSAVEKLLSPFCSFSTTPHHTALHHTTPLQNMYLFHYSKVPPHSTPLPEGIDGSL